MGWLFNFWNSSIGKKLVMAITGICLILFLLVHLAGNFTLYFGRETFNTYASTLGLVKPVVRIIELVLALIIILHIINAVRLWIENKIARPVDYKINASSKNSTFSSRTMILTGSAIFIFLVVHLQTFWYKYNFTGTEHPDLYEIVVGWFQVEWYSILYIVAMIVMGFHLNHGFQSAFQTFGWNHNKYSPVIKTAGTIYAFLMAIGFAAIPFYFLLIYGGS